MRPIRKRGSIGSQGFTLVELMIVVAIIGVLAALAIYGTKQYLAAAKTAEARDGVGAISRVAVAVFEREVANAQLLASATMGAAATQSLCTSAAPVPASMNSVKGTKYQPSSLPGADYSAGNSTAGWVCLNNFSFTQPTYYQYHYYAGSGYIAVPLGAPDPGNNGFEAAARGDLDGDGTFSMFGRTGRVQNGHLRLATQLFVHDELE